MFQRKRTRIGLILATSLMLNGCLSQLALKPVDEPIVAPLPQVVEPVLPEPEPEQIAESCEEPGPFPPAVEVEPGEGNPVAAQEVLDGVGISRPLVADQPDAMEVRWLLIRFYETRQRWGDAAAAAGRAMEIDSAQGPVVEQLIDRCS